MRGVVLAVLLAACGTHAPGARPDAGPPPIDVATVNAAVPPPLAGKLRFVPADEGAKGRWRAAVPDGWKPSDILAGVYDAPAELGLASRLGVDSNCDGACVAKDWAAVADRVEFAPLAGLGFAIEKDEKLPDGRIAVARAPDGRVRVVAAFWKEGAPVYFACKARLEPPAAPAAPAFEAACRRVQILKWTE